MDPVFTAHLEEQADALVGKSLFAFIHPNEQASAKHDLGCVIESRILHGSVTRFVLSAITPRHIDRTPPPLQRVHLSPYRDLCLPEGLPTLTQHRINWWASHAARRLQQDRIRLAVASAIL
jgi:hypothetical protein